MKGVIVMRIEAYNKVAEIYGVNRARKTGKSKYAPIGRDKVEISSHATDLKVAKEAVAGTPDTREDLVADIKSRIDSGSYSVDTGDFASVLLSRYKELSDKE